MNNHKRGYFRDNKILDLIEEWRVLDTNQIRVLVFPDTQYGLRKCQNRLQTLRRKGNIICRQISKDKPYVYSTEPREQLEHMVNINYCRLWIMQNLKSWESLWCWKYEQDFEILRADALFGIKNQGTGQIRFWFLEVERSHNRMIKGELYNKLFESRQPIWTAEYDNRFPGVLLVKDGKMEVRNKNGLEIRTVTMEEVRDCLARKSLAI